ncbi:MAG TPA: cytochrome P450 [Pseudonocardiaceae bacterium]|jgi:cytochrome P450|nr:cytochrome P450 [Pseudonocardiaceae bacterium]
MQDSATAVPEQLGDDFVNDPHAMNRRLREEAPVHPVVLPRGLKVWLVTRYADVRSALADATLSKDSANINELFTRHSTSSEEFAGGSAELAGHMLNSDPPDHERLRRMVNKAFTARRIEKLRPRIEEITSGLITDIGPAAEVDLLDVFAFPLPITVICVLLGVPTKDREDFRRWSNVLVSGGVEPAEIQEAATAMVGYLSDMIAAKRAEPGEDMMSALIAASDAGDRLSHEELIGMAFLLLVAGHETTVNLIANGLLALITNPDQLAALRADRSLLPGAIEEFLRFESPVKNATLRYTTVPTDVGGVVVPAGEFLVLSLGSANRDPDRYPDPDRLDIGRDVSGHMAFGHGIHYCLGAPLARLEAEIAFTRLLDAYDRIELTVPVAELNWRPGILIRGLERFPVRLV